MITTFDEVTAWIAEHHKDPRDTRTPHEKAMWFFAHRIAEQMRDAYDAKDWAELVLEGYQPLTKAEIDEQLEDFAKDPDIEPEDTDLTEEIEFFFRG